MDGGAARESYPPGGADRFAQIAELFEAALGLGPEDREGLLEARCGDNPELRQEVESLLRGAEEGGPLDGDSSALDSGWALDALHSELEPTRVMAPGLPHSIGPYSILEELGSGGMGRVYLARRADADFHKQVAVKVLRPGLDGGDPDGHGLLSRFRSERRILAQLEHPYVATLLDGGATEEGLPYLVMEHVDGLDLIQHAQREDLSVRERLDLFGRVCEAVAALHRNLIVHRDLKPSNILITAEGLPKLLDFGIAKILESDDTGQTVVHTQTGMMLYTPEYASPEQSQGRAITTASDVYSLGVLLFELLAGSRPYAFERRTPAEFERVLSEVDPPTMSSVAPTEARTLAGDLDTIVAMALRKEPERRYGSVLLLAEDIERYQKGLPVRARKDTFRYRTGKFLRRRAGLVVGAGLFLVLLTAFAISMARAAERTGRQRDLANLRADMSDEVSRFLVNLFRVSAPDGAVGEQISARSLLDRGANEIRYGVRKDPAVRAALMDAMGRAYLALGNTEEASGLLTQAERLLAPLEAEAAKHASVQAELGMVEFLQGNNARAEGLLRDSLKVLEGAFPGPHPEVERVRLMLSDQLRSMGQFDEALELAQLASGNLEAMPQASERERLHGLVVQARQHEARGDYAEAESLLQRVRERQSQVFDGDHPDQASTLRALAQLHESQGRLDEGIAAIEEAIRIDSAILGADHPNVSDHQFTLAALHQEAGDLDAALLLFRTILKGDRERYGEHLYVTLDLNDIAGILSQQGELAEAEGLYRESLAMQRRVLEPGHPEIATSLSNLAVCLGRMGRHDEAQGYLEQALELRLAAYPADHPAVLTSRNILAIALQRSGELEQALPQAQAVLEARRAKLGEHPQVAGSLFTVGSMLEGLGRHAEATEHFEESIEIYRSTLPPDHLDLARPLHYWGGVLIEHGETEQARLLLEEALKIRSAKLPPDHRDRQRSAELLMGLGS